MNHNPHHLQVGDIVIIDEGFSNSGEVRICDFTSEKMFATISEPDNKDESDTWEVMTYRLTPKNKEKHETQETESQIGQEN